MSQLLFGEPITASTAGEREKESPHLPPDNKKVCRLTPPAVDECFQIKVALAENH
jgi:hypothetical protein